MTIEFYDRQGCFTLDLLDSAAEEIAALDDDRKGLLLDLVGIAKEMEAAETRARTAIARVNELRGSLDCAEKGLIAAGPEVTPNAAIKAHIAAHQRSFLLERHPDKVEAFDADAAKAAEAAKKNSHPKTAVPNRKKLTTQCEALQAELDLARAEMRAATDSLKVWRNRNATALTNWQRAYPPQDRLEMTRAAIAAFKPHVDAQRKANNFLDKLRVRKVDGHVPVHANQRRPHLPGSR